MDKNSIAEVDERIKVILESMIKMQGELDGLRFARKLLVKSEAAAERETLVPLAQALSAEMQDKPSIRNLALRVIKANSSGQSYRDVCKRVEQLAGRPINYKTVSSSLDALKNKGLITSSDGMYMPVK